MANWDAGLYLKFGAERTRPAADLAARVDVASPARVVDLGCGPGNSTAVVKARWPHAAVVGVDNSPAMIAAAREADPAGAWELAEVAAWSPPAQIDVVFSNATLHWVPDHAAVFPRLFGMVAPGGALAVQVPTHYESAVHRLMGEIADRPEWRDRMAGAKAALWTGRPGFYYDLLAPFAARLDLWETEYQHVMADPAAIVTWIRGTGLRPYLEALADHAERAAFERLLLEGVTAAYPRRADGKVLFPFRRLFAVAYRAGDVQ